MTAEQTGSGIQIASVNGIEMAYERIGNGPLVMLIGGIDMDIPIWKRSYVGTFIERGYSVLVVNLRGVPPSTVSAPPYSVQAMAFDCLALLDALGIAQCFVVGASLGAFVAQEMVLAYPEGKQGLALIATAPRQTAWVKMLTQAELALYEAPGPLPLNYLVASDLLQIFTVDELCNDQFVQRMVASMKAKEHLAVGRRGLLSAVASYEGCIDRLSDLQVPTLFISFADDVLTPALLAKQASEIVRDGRYVEIASAGHAGIYSKSATVVQEITACFDDICRRAEAA